MFRISRSSVLCMLAMATTMYASDEGHTHDVLEDDQFAVAVDDGELEMARNASRKGECYYNSNGKRVVAAIKKHDETAGLARVEQLKQRITHADEADYAEMYNELRSLLVLPYSGREITLVNGSTLFPYDGYKGLDGIIALMIAKGMPLDVVGGCEVNPDGSWSLVHCAVFGSQEAVLKQLLNARVSPDMQDHDGMTPLHLAARLHKLSSVKLLVEAHANVNIHNKFERTPLDLAVGGVGVSARNQRAWQEGRDAIKKYLKEHGAEFNKPTELFLDE